MEQSIKQLDNIIDTIAGEVGAEPLKCDPDDPWFKENLIKAPSVSKVRCATCGYYYTLPFEKECPICEFTSGKKQEAKFELDVEAIRNICKHTKPSGENKAEKKEGKKEGKKEEKKEEKVEEKKEEDKKDEKPAAQKQEKAEKKKKEKAPQQPKKPSGDDLNQCFSHAFFQIARLQKCVKHPEADKLIVTEADLGNGELRTLVTGLIPHYQPEDLENRLVCVVKNLKPKKMMGIEGNVMLLASTNSETGKIQIIQVPDGSVPGDRVYPEGFPLLAHIKDNTLTHENPDTLYELYQGGTGEEMPEVPKKQFEKIVAGFKILKEHATFYEKPLRSARGYLLSPGTPDGSEFH